MSTSKHINKICIAVVAVMLVITIVFMCGESLGLKVLSRSMKYESTLFDTSYVHKIDIEMNNWDSFIEKCENEEYSACTVVIDGNKHSNIAIRAKGNTSLSSVRSMGSQRYSFKLEFDHFEKQKTLDGLDKLCLNNLIQDNTMMKDYLVYRMMNDFNVTSPLCSFAYLTVNGEDWGLYLAVEGVEDSFLTRNYGKETGSLYKPDSMSFGGGRGNGKDFRMDDFDFENSDTDEKKNPDFVSGKEFNFGDSTPPPSDGEKNHSRFPNMPEGGKPDFGDFSPENMPNEGMPEMPGGKGGFGGMGSDDVKLKYIDDDIDSYSNIFDNAKTDITTEDKTRLINSLKNLSEYSNLDDIIDTDEVIRYFVVHNFVCNGDSYTGNMIHNYYLHENKGKLSMIPWDYNLAFGTFQGNNASSSVNASVDSPVSGESVDDRPMLGWIFSDDSYTEEYHRLLDEFTEKWFSDGELKKLISDTADMLRPYVKKDPTKFCTVEEFEKGVTAISEFVSLRAEAVKRQIKGDDTSVDTDGLNLSDMGTMGNMGGKMPSMHQNGKSQNEELEAKTSEKSKEKLAEKGEESTTEAFSEPSGELPQPPDNFNGEMPSMPDGEKPEMPPGGFGDMGVPPEMPGRNMNPPQ